MQIKSTDYNDQRRTSLTCTLLKQGEVLSYLGNIKFPFVLKSYIGLQFIHGVFYILRTLLIIKGEIFCKSFVVRHWLTSVEKHFLEFSVFFPAKTDENENAKVSVAWPEECKTY